MRAAAGLLIVALSAMACLTSTARAADADAGQAPSAVPAEMKITPEVTANLDVALVVKGAQPPGRPPGKT